jgi:hypothetical protein
VKKIGGLNGVDAKQMKPLLLTSFELGSVFHRMALQSPDLETFDELARRLVDVQQGTYRDQAKLSRYKSCIQNRDETVREYYHTLRMAYGETGRDVEVKNGEDPLNDDLVFWDKFVSGLLPPLREAVQRELPTTLRDTLKCADKAEASLHSQTGRACPVVAAQPMADVLSDLTKTLAQMTTAFQGIETRLTQLEKKDTRRPFDVNGRPNGRLKSPVPHSQSFAVPQHSNEYCTRCGRWNHVESHCRSNSSLVCYRCSRTGHTARFCTVQRGSPSVPLRSPGRHSSGNSHLSNTRPNWGNSAGGQKKPATASTPQLN